MDMPRKNPTRHDLAGLDTIARRIEAAAVDLRALIADMQQHAVEELHVPYNKKLQGSLGGIKQFVDAAKDAFFEELQSCNRRSPNGGE